jgi:hypothetical protein
VLDDVHGIDSYRVQVVTNHLDTKGTKAVPHQNIVFHGLLKLIDWKIVDGLVAQHGGERDTRGLKVRAHLVAMLYAQFCGAACARWRRT